MAKAPHPSELRDAQLIRSASHFNAMAFIGSGNFDRIDDLATLEAAKAEAAKIEARNPGRQAMIYAVTAEGRSCIVTAQLEKLIMETDSIFTKDYSAKSAAIRALKHSGLEPDQAEVRADGKRWVIRKPGAAASPAPAQQAAQPARAAAGAKRISPLRAQENARAEKAAVPAKRRKSDANQPKTRQSYDRSGAKAARAGAEPKPAKPAKAAGAPRTNKAFAEAMEAAAKGKLPSAPDFSAETHKPYRAKLARVSELAKAGDLKTLRAETAAWKPYNSSMLPLIRYRDLCAAALEAKQR